MSSPATLHGSAPHLFLGGDISLPSSAGITKTQSPALSRPLPLGGSEASTTNLSAEQRAHFAEEWPVAVSLGWEHVIRLLESCSPDPNTQQMLRALVSD